MTHTPRALVIQTESLEPGPAAWLAERCQLLVCPHTERGRLAELLPRADGLIVRTYTKVNAAMLDQAPRLRVVARAGVGLDNIDLPECARRGVAVVHTPGANTRAVVEYVTRLMLDALRPSAILDGPVPESRWHELRQELTATRQLTEMTLGIYGLGRIGSGMARVGAALDMRVIYHDIREIPAASRFGASPVGRDELLRTSDVLTIHVDERPSNAKIIDARACALLKPEVLFVNAARGMLVDPGALAEFLRTHPRAAALLDVHDPTEPFTAEYPLVGVHGARLTPHLAAATVTAKTNMSWVVRDVWRVLNGEPPEYPAPGTNLGKAE